MGRIAFHASLLRLVLLIGLAQLAACAAAPSVPPTIPSAPQPSAARTIPPTVEVVPATATFPPPQPTPTQPFGGACGSAPAEISPDGRWALCNAKDDSGQSTAYLIASNGKRWEVDYRKQLSRDIPVYDDSLPLVWTPDGRYVYVALVGSPASGGPRTFYAASDLWRMDLASGALKDLVPAGQLPYGSSLYDLAVSPDGRRIAYVNQWQTPLNLEILDLPSDARTRVVLADSHPGSPTPDTAGELFWTPDGGTLIYKLVTAHTGNPCSYEYSILALDLRTRATQTVVPQQHVPICDGAPMEFHIIQVDNQHILLVQQGVDWTYDLGAKALMQVAVPTPTP